MVGLEAVVEGVSRESSRLASSSSSAAVFFVAMLGGCVRVAQSSFAAVYAFRVTVNVDLSAGIAAV